jgi:hypothetical protein
MSEHSANLAARIDVLSWELTAMFTPLQDLINDPMALYQEIEFELRMNLILAKQTQLLRLIQVQRQIYTVKKARR